MIKATLESTGQALLSTSRGSGCPRQRSNKTKDGRAPSKRRPVACLGSDPAGLGAQQTPPSAPKAEAPGDHRDTRSKQLDKQAHSPIGSPVGGWPGTAPLHPLQALGRAQARGTGGGGGPPLPSLFRAPASLCSGGPARAGCPSMASPDCLAPLAWHPVQP